MTFKNLRQKYDINANHITLILDVYMLSTVTYVKEDEQWGKINRQLVRWCFEPSQPLGLNTNSNLLISYSAHKSLHTNHNNFHSKVFFFLIFFFIPIPNILTLNIHKYNKNQHTLS